MSSKIHESNTFVTAVDVGGSATSPKTTSPTRSVGGSPQHSMVRKLADEEFEFIPGSMPQELPNNVNYRQLVEDVLDTVIDPEDSQSQRVWSAHIPSQEYNSIVKDLFWYCYLHIFRKPTGRSLTRPTKAEAAEQKVQETNKQNLLDRISQSYGSLFYNVVISGPLLARESHNNNSNNSTSDGDVLFQTLSNAVAQSIYIAFFQAYPRSRRQINTAEIRDELVDICGLRLDGVRPSICKHDHWLNSQDQQAARKKHPLGVGAKKGPKTKPNETTFVRSQKGPSMPIKPRVHLQKRRTKLSGTPMLANYLPKNSRWNMNIGLMQDPKNRPLTDIEKRESKHNSDGGEKHTEEGEEKEPTAEELYQEEQDEMLKQSMKNVSSKTYQDVVKETRSHAKLLIRTHRQKYSSLIKDLAAGRKQIRKEQKALDEQCKEIQGKDAHEQANYIVSRMDLQSKLRKQRKK
jgi:hypothetical protein